MKRPKSIDTALKAAKPVLRNYVLAIETKNLKCEKEIAYLQAEVVTQQYKIAALKTEMKKLAKKRGFNLNITFSGDKQLAFGGKNG